MAEQLTEEDGYPVDHETRRRWLLDQGLGKRSRKSPPHRQRRLRTAHCGELVQPDGLSVRRRQTGRHPDWFETRQEAGRMELAEDATGKTLAQLEEEETTREALFSLWAWLKRYGIPCPLEEDG